MNKNIIFIILVILTIYGCGEKTGEHVYAPPVFPADEEMIYEIVHDDLLIPPMVPLMGIYKDYLVMVYLNKEKNTWIHIHNKNTAEEITSALNKGRGPHEIIFPTSRDFNPETGELSIFGEGGERLMIFHIDSLVNGNFTPRYVDEPLFRAFNMERISPLGDDKYLVRMYTFAKKAQYRRYVLLDKGKVTDHNEQYPIEDSLLISISYGFSKVPLSPDKTKFAVGTSSGWILEFFDITNGIKNVRTDYYHQLFWNETKTSPDILKSGYGFMDMACDDKYVYASSGEPGTKRIDNITIFDWEGNPVKILRALDYKAMYPIALDQATGELYAWARNDEGEHHIIRIKPFADNES